MASRNSAGMLTSPEFTGSIKIADAGGAFGFPGAADAGAGVSRGTRVGFGAVIEVRAVADQICAELFRLVFRDSEDGSVQSVVGIAISDAEHVNFLDHHERERGAAVIGRGHRGSLCHFTKFSAGLRCLRSDINIFDGRKLEACRAIGPRRSAARRI